MKLKDPSLLRLDSYIDGKWIDAGSKRFAVTNPATGDVIAEVADHGADQVTAAIDAAVPAQKAWAKKTAKERAMIMRKWYDLIMQNADDLAIILTTEMGKPLTEAKGEIAYGASFVDWFAEEARRVCGDVLETPQSDKRLLTFKQPIGVFGAITPWNFP
ncbi:MAG: aldehyde dehydrogenase family protein, partial [Alphaproteobacteria bacterium]